MYLLIRGKLENKNKSFMGLLLLKLPSQKANHFFAELECYNLVSISPTFYEQFLCAQILKAQKTQSSGQSFLPFRDLRVLNIDGGTLIRLALN